MKGRHYIVHNTPFKQFCVCKICFRRLPDTNVSNIWAKCQGVRGKLQLLFFASGVLLANFNFSFPRIPKIASLLYFWVFVVKEKVKIISKLLARFAYKVWFYFTYCQIKIKNHLKSASQRDSILARYGFKLLGVAEKIKISSKILARCIHTIFSID